MPVVQPQIAVIGAGTCDEGTAVLAEEIGKDIASSGAVLLCGGLGGVMAAAARGAKNAGGVTVGILPGESSADANPHITIKIATNLGHARNVLIAHSADALIAVAGSYGTLSEIAIALRLGKPVISLNSWCVDDKIIVANSAIDAVEKAFVAIGARG